MGKIQNYTLSSDRDLSSTIEQIKKSRIIRAKFRKPNNTRINSPTAKIQIICESC